MKQQLSCLAILTLLLQPTSAILGQAAAKPKSKLSTEQISHAPNENLPTNGAAPKIPLKGGSLIGQKRNLFNACKIGNETQVRSLLSQNAPVNTQHEGSTPLHQACIKGNLGIVNMLLEKGAAPNQLDRNKATPLHIACGLNHTLVAKELIAKGALLDSKDHQGKTPLHIVIEKGNLELAKYFLGRTPQLSQLINDTDNQLRTALHIACSLKHDQQDAIVECLLSRGCAHSLPDNEGNTPLHIACEVGVEPCVRFLIQAGAQLRAKNIDGLTPFHTVAKQGKGHLVELFLDKDAGAAECKDNSEKVPLDYLLEFVITRGQRDSLAHALALLDPQGAKEFSKKNELVESLFAACKSNHQARVEQLLAEGASVATMTKTGNLPLQVACQEGHLALAQSLIEKYDASVAACDGKACTPLHVACSYGHDAIAQLLLNNFAPIDARDGLGRTPLHIASMAGRTQVVRTLLKHKPQVNIKDLDHQTALHKASALGHRAVVDVLLAVDPKLVVADIDVKDRHNLTPEELAQKHGHEDVVKSLSKERKQRAINAQPEVSDLFLACTAGDFESVDQLFWEGVPVDSKTPTSDTALHLACQGGHKKIVEFLLQKGSSVDAVNLYGQTPLHMACMGGNLEVVTELCAQLKSGEETKLLNSVDIHGRTPLHYACMEGHANVIKYLALNTKVKKDVIDHYRSLPVMHARKKRLDPAILNLLHSQIISSQPQEELITACAAENVERVRRITTNQPSAVFGVDALQSTALHMATNREIASALIAQGARIDAPDIEGQTPLHLACYRNLISVAELLIEHGAAIDVSDQKGFTPLHLACMQNNLDMVNLLLRHGASAKTVVGNTAYEYETPWETAKRKGFEHVALALQSYQLGLNSALMQACTRNRFQEMQQNDLVQALLKKEVNLTKAYTLEAEENKKSIAHLVSLLLNNGADPNMRYNSKLPLWHRLCELGHAETIETLLKNGVNVQALDSTGRTALHVLCDFEHSAKQSHFPELARCLIRHNIHIDKKDASGKTALHYAVQHGNILLAKLLVESGAISIIPDNAGKTARDYALESRLPAIQNLLPSEVAIPETLVTSCKEGNMVLAREQLSESYAKSITPSGATLLHVAAANGNATLINILVDEYNAPLDARNKQGMTPLHLATQEGHVDAITTLTNLGATVDAVASTGQTALHLASERGRIDIVELLAQRGADVDATDHSGQTPLHKASKRGDFDETAATLIKHGALVNAPDASHRTPLHVACENGRLNIVEVLLYRHANVHTTDKEKNTPLHCCCIYDNPKIAELLIARGARSNAKNSKQETPEKIAKMRGFNGVAEVFTRYQTRESARRNSVVAQNFDNNLLIQQACKEGNYGLIKGRIRKVHEMSERRSSKTVHPLHVACKHHQPAIVDLLLEEGIDKNQKDVLGRSALHIACTAGYEDIVSQLINNKVDISAKDMDGRNALHYSSLGGSSSMAQKLLDAGADQNEPDKEGTLPLHLVCKLGYLDLVKQLANQKNLTAQDMHGKTPLHIASINGNLKVVQWIITTAKQWLEDGVEILNPIHCTDNKGCTPLHDAVDIGDADVVRLLVKHKANINAPDSSDLTPLQRALGDKEREDIAILLKRANLDEKTGAQATAPQQSSLLAELIQACRNNNLQQATVALSHGAPVNEQFQSSGTALHIASQFGSEQLVTRLIDQFKAHVNAVDANLHTPLHLANSSKIVAALLARYASRQAKNKLGDTPLEKARKDMNLEILRALYRPAANISIELEPCVPNLFKACQTNNLERVKELTQCPEFIPPTTFLGSPIHYACMSGHAEIVSYLLGCVQGRSVNTENFMGETPLHLACAQGNSEIVTMLLDYPQTDVHATTKHKHTPLHYASAEGHLDIVNRLLGKDAIVDAVSHDNRSPLHYACNRGHTTVVGALLNAGANTSLRDCEELTPLELAQISGHHLEEYFTQALLAQQNGPLANPTSTVHEPIASSSLECEELTDLELAQISELQQEESFAQALTSQKNASLASPMSTVYESVESLPLESKPSNAKTTIVHDDDDEVTDTPEAASLAKDLASDQPKEINIIEKPKDTAQQAISAVDDVVDECTLFDACENGDEEIVKKCIEAGLSISAPDTNGNRPLLIATEAGHQTIVKILLTAGASPNDINREHQTALHLAVEDDNLEIVELLTTNKVKVSEPDQSEHTPLHLAARRGNLEMVTALLGNNARINAKTSESTTPLHLACKGGHEAIVALLLAKGANKGIKDKSTVPPKTPLEYAKEHGFEGIVNLLSKKNART